MEIIFMMNLSEKNYIFWYSIIVACSFVREEDTKKKYAFVPEYVIPQLFIQ